jgi:hypothetical protein
LHPESIVVSCGDEHLTFAQLADRVFVPKDADALVFPALRDGCHLNDSVFAKHFGRALENDWTRVLALTETQTPPNTIARRLGVHHSAVRRILAATPELDGSGSGPGAIPGVAE